jgi:plasmid stabilization system protein ParE
MSFTVIVLPRAARQTAVAAAWWRANHTEAPEQFVEELGRALAHLGETPSPLVRGQPSLQRLHLHKLDYALYYQVRPRLQRVDVVAFWHTDEGTPASVMPL